MAGSANEQFTRDLCVDDRIQELTLDSDEEELGGALADSSASEVAVDSVEMDFGTKTERRPAIYQPSQPLEYGIDGYY